MTDLRQYRVPIRCPLCNYLLKGNKNTSSFYSWGCCTNCYIEFIETREARWKQGWRPDSAEITAYLAKIR